MIKELYNRWVKLTQESVKVLMEDGVFIETIHNGDIAIVEQKDGKTTIGLSGQLNDDERSFCLFLIAQKLRRGLITEDKGYLITRAVDEDDANALIVAILGGIINPNRLITEMWMEYKSKSADFVNVLDEYNKK